MSARRTVLFAIPATVLALALGYGVFAHRSPFGQPPLAIMDLAALTDWMRPSTIVLARLTDRCGAQYWDPDHLLAKQMSKDARDPQPKEKCCTRKGVLWDLAAVYPPGATWDDVMPPAVFFNGPVANVRDQLEAELKRP